MGEGRVSAISVNLAEQRPPSGRKHDTALYSHSRVTERRLSEP